MWFYSILKASFPRAPKLSPEAGRCFFARTEFYRVAPFPELRVFSSGNFLSSTYQRTPVRPLEVPFDRAVIQANPLVFFVLIWNQGRDPSGMGKAPFSHPALAQTREGHNKSNQSNESLRPSWRPLDLPPFPTAQVERPIGQEGEEEEWSSGTLSEGDTPNACKG